jgi:hypothetical protein
MPNPGKQQRTSISYPDRQTRVQHDNVERLEDAAGLRGAPSNAVYCAGEVFAYGNEFSAITHTGDDHDPI